MMYSVLAHLPGLSFSLDPMNAEAKGRMRRPRVLGALLALLLAAGAVAAVLWLRSPADQWAQVPVGRFGIVRIPGMTEVASDRATSICGGTGLRPAYCSPGASVTEGLDQTWVATAIVEQYDARHVPLWIPAAFASPHRQAPIALARRHPGAAEVSVELRKFGDSFGVATAQQLLRAQGFIGSDSRAYRPRTSWALHGGLAGAIDPQIDNFGLDEFRFAWTSGRTVVLVRVIGADLSIGAAQRIARLAGPTT